MNLGHCIGVDCNEKPWITPGDKTLARGGHGSQRELYPTSTSAGEALELEDTVLVTKKGLRFLNNTERTLYLL